MKLKRLPPDRNEILARAQYLENFSRKDFDTVKLSVSKDDSDIKLPHLEMGNSKTGRSGVFFEKILVWNLPPIITCPGASEWCKRNCYNADTNKHYPMKEWENNLWWALHKMEELKKHLIERIMAEENIAVRIHSSGDFFSLNYINMWREIAAVCRNAYFWAYTRSWAVEELHDAIICLSEIANISLFASYDSTMGLKCHELYSSLAVEPNDLSDYNSPQFYVCPEQFTGGKCCADCGFCITRGDRDVVFTVH